MKNTFIGYYRPSENEFAELWAKANVVVDANVLLAVYGVSPLTAEALLRLLELETIKTRLWIPHQFALEYQRNRRGKILDQVKNYEDTHRDLRTILDDQFRSNRQHPFVSEETEKELERTCENLLEGKTKQESLLKSDHYFDRTTELFQGRVGAPFSDPELKQVYEAASLRFDKKIPPGFKDADKPVPERFGDYVGWRQILDFGLKNNASVMLITDDAKEDWWRQERGKPIGPRPELVAEFRSCCSALFYMYPSDRFLELSATYLGRAVDPKAISELKERRESEAAPDVMKSTGVVATELPLKSAGYIPESGANAMLDTPKLTSLDPEKSEEE